MSTTRTARPKKVAHKRPKQLSNDKLLQLARKHRPPQSWYDDETDPFQPKSKSK